MTKKLSLLPVQMQDYPALVALINDAYRGNGWTTETHLLQGSARIDEPTLRQQSQLPGACLLKCVDEENSIMGCVFLQKQDSTLQLGMLSVSPRFQDAGTGKFILTAAVDYSRQQQCNKISIQVISVRDELIQWYERRGFYRTGATAPFPTDNRFGTPVQPLEFAVLEMDI